MDVVLEVADPLLFDWLYAQPPFSLGAAGPLFSERDGAVRQSLSLYLVTVVFGYVLYFLFGFLNYWLLYDKKQLQHPKFLPNQIRREITLSAASLPLMALLTLPVYLAEVRGYSRLYSDWSEYSLSYTCMSAIFFLLFTDACIYWIHRALHLPLFYAAFHKPHHLWKVPTPFASHAFHPIVRRSLFAAPLPFHGLTQMGRTGTCSRCHTTSSSFSFPCTRFFTWVSLSLSTFGLYLSTTGTPPTLPPILIFTRKSHQKFCLC